MYSIIITILFIAVIFIFFLYLKFNNNFKKIQSLKNEKDIVNDKIKMVEVEKEILINHAKDANEKTIKSKKQLEDAKNEYVKGAGGSNPDDLLKRIRGKYNIN